MALFFGLGLNSKVWAEENTINEVNSINNTTIKAIVDPKIIHEHKCFSQIAYFREIDRLLRCNHFNEKMQKQLFFNNHDFGLLT